MAQQLAPAQQNQKSEVNTDTVYRTTEPNDTRALAVGEGLQEHRHTNKQFQTEGQNTWQGPATCKSHAKKLAQCISRL